MICGWWTKKDKLELICYCPILPDHNDSDQIWVAYRCKHKISEVTLIQSRKENIGMLQFRSPEKSGCRGRQHCVQDHVIVFRITWHLVFVNVLVFVTMRLCLATSDCQRQRMDMEHLKHCRCAALEGKFVVRSRSFWLALQRRSGGLLERKWRPYGCRCSDSLQNNTTKYNLCHTKRSFSFLIHMNFFKL